MSDEYWDKKGLGRKKRRGDAPAHAAAELELALAEKKQKEGELNEVLKEKQLKRLNQIIELFH